MKKRIRDRLEKRLAILNSAEIPASPRVRQILDEIHQDIRWRKKYPNQSKPKHIPDLQDLQEEHANTSPLKTLHWRKP